MERIFAISRAYVTEIIAAAKKACAIWLKTINLAAQLMKTNAFNFSKPQPQRVNHQRKNLSWLLLVGVALQSSCSSHTAQVWSKIQADGLIPYLAQRESAEKPQEAQTATAGTTLPLLRTENRSSPLVMTGGAGVVTAQAVPGKPGFVYSPHTVELAEIDVRDHQAGVRVRCPYTHKPFLVPAGSGPGVVLAQREADPAPVRRDVSPMRSGASPVRRDVSPPEEATTKPAPELAREEVTDADTIAAAPEEEPESVPLETVVDPPLDPNPTRIAAGPETIPSSGDLLGLPATPPAEEIPLGRWVPGKPNYVFSPFAASNQVVDIEGLAPGTKVKCPYTGKVFAIPAKD